MRMTHASKTDRHVIWTAHWRTSRLGAPKNDGICLLSRPYLGAPHGDMIAASPASALSDARGIAAIEQSNSTPIEGRQ